MGCKGRAGGIEEGQRYRSLVFKGSGGRNGRKLKGENTWSAGLLTLTVSAFLWGDMVRCEEGGVVLRRGGRK